MPSGTGSAVSSMSTDHGGSDPAVTCTDLGFSWPKQTEPTLSGITFSLPKGCRSVIVGSNGAGKTCLLGCVGGVHHYSGNVNVLGKEAYQPTRIGTSGAVELVGGINVWRHGDCTIVGERWQPRGDCKVSSMLFYIDGWTEVRRDEIVDRFGIDLNWRVNQLSDGKKRRVQLLLAFLLPSKVLLLDEVTTDLDVLARQTLLQWLKEESEERDVTVLFSTHIFDGLENWGTHVTHIRAGELGLNAPMDKIPELEDLRRQGRETPLFDFVESLCRKDAEVARAKGVKSTRGMHPQAGGGILSVGDQIMLEREIEGAR
mmetsp:Transcript_53327/g.130254  ORF Transcript_53327/g.130254 Transcript_53327/m.130254 type:complete len:315 (-) Transcript_53327:55-999(-)